MTRHRIFLILVFAWIIGTFHNLSDNRDSSEAVFSLTIAVIVLFGDALRLSGELEVILELVERIILSPIDWSINRNQKRELKIKRQIEINNFHLSGHLQGEEVMQLNRMTYLDRAKAKVKILGITKDFLVRAQVLHVQMSSNARLEVGQEIEVDPKDLEVIKETKNG